MSEHNREEYQVEKTTPRKEVYLLICRSLAHLQFIFTISNEIWVKKFIAYGIINFERLKNFIRKGVKHFVIVRNVAIAVSLFTNEAPINWHINHDAQK